MPRYYTPRAVTPILDRVLARLDRSGPCWLWPGAKSRGYGNVRAARRGKLLKVHRVVFEAFRGPIPPKMELDHTCTARNCANPDHLEMVTHEENMKRMRSRKTTGAW